MREDLSPAQKIVQTAHSVIEATSAFSFQDLADHPSLIVLSAKNESRLCFIEKYLQDHNIKHVSFREPDLDHQLTSITTEPIFDEKRKIFRKFELVK